MSPELKALIEKSRKCYERGKEILEKARTESRQLTVEEQGNVDKAFSDALTFKKEADVIHEREQKSQQLETFLNTPVANHPYDVGDSPESKTADVELAKKVFNKYLHGGLKNETMSRLERKELSRLSDADGGYLLTEDFRTELLTALDDEVMIRQYATVIQTNKAQVTAPAWDYDETPSQRRDNAAYSEEDYSNALGKLKFTPESWGKILKVPEELIEDTEFAIQPFLINRFAVAIGETEESDYLNGTGVAQPLGILNAGITAYDLKTALSGDLVPNDIREFPYNMKAQYRKRGTWNMGRATLLKVMILRENSGGAETGRYMWQPSMQAGKPSILDGYPVLENEFFPSASSDGDAVLAFGDWWYYWIVDRLNLTIQMLHEKYAEYGQVGIKLRKRSDAGLTDVNAFIRLDRN